MSRIAPSGASPLVCRQATAADLAELDEETADLFSAAPGGGFGALCAVSAHALNGHGRLPKLTIEISALADGREGESNPESVLFQIVRTPAENPELISPYFADPDHGARAVMIEDGTPALSLNRQFLLVLENDQRVYQTGVTVSSSQPFLSGDVVNLSYETAIPEVRTEVTISVRTSTSPGCEGETSAAAPRINCTFTPPVVGNYFWVTIDIKVHDAGDRELPRDLGTVRIEESRAAEGFNFGINGGVAVIREAEVSRIGFQLLNQPPTDAEESSLRDTRAHVYVPAGEHLRHAKFAQITLSAPLPEASTVTVSVFSSTCGGPTSACAYEWTAYGGVNPDDDAVFPDDGFRNLYMPLPAGAQKLWFAISTDYPESIYRLILSPIGDLPISILDANAERFSVAIVEPEPTLAQIVPREVNLEDGEDAVAGGLLVGGVSRQPVWLRSSAPLAPRPMTVYLWPNHIGDSADRPIDADGLSGRWNMRYELDFQRTGPVSGVWPGTLKRDAVSALTGEVGEQTGRLDTMWRYVFTPLPGEREIRFHFSVRPPPDAAESDGVTRLRDQPEYYGHGRPHDGLRRLNLSTTPYPDASFSRELFIYYPKRDAGGDRRCLLNPERIIEYLASGTVFPQPQPPVPADFCLRTHPAFPDDVLEWERTYCPAPGSDRIFTYQTFGYRCESGSARSNWGEIPEGE